MATKKPAFTKETKKDSKAVEVKEKKGLTAKQFAAQEKGEPKGFKNGGKLSGKC